MAPSHPWARHHGYLERYDTVSRRGHLVTYRVRYWIADRRMEAARVDGTERHWVDR
jgi:hypothetical protein